MARRLHEIGVINTEQYSLYRDLLEVHSRVASGLQDAITHQEVERFLGMTAQLIQQIDNVLGIVTKSHSFLARYSTRA
jgi:Mn-dependent DtxR family transcriptional regulator